MNIRLEILEGIPNSRNTYEEIRWLYVHADKTQIDIIRILTVSIETVRKYYNSNPYPGIRNRISEKRRCNHC